MQLSPPPLESFPLAAAGIPLDAELEFQGLGALLPEDADPVRLRYHSANGFLGLYLRWLRRGETLLVDSRRVTFVGDMMDIEIWIDGYPPLLLFAQVVGVCRGRAEVRFVAGRLTDRAIRSIARRALGPRHAAGLLRAMG
jgi:hypothetical protein